MEIFYHIEGDGFHKYNHTAIHMGFTHRRSQHLCSISTVRRYRKNHPGQIPKDRQRIVIMEMPTETLLIAQSGNTQNHGVGKLTFREKSDCCCFTAQLVFCIMKISQKLDLWDRNKPIMTKSDSKSNDGCFIQ